MVILTQGNILMISFMAMALSNGLVGESLHVIIIKMKGTRSILKSMVSSTLTRTNRLVNGVVVVVRNMVKGN
jgi:hypothetical protein